MSVNKAILIGRLGKDPEVRNLDGGSTVCNFSMATSKKYKDEEYTEWHNIVMWGKLAEIAEKYLKKGDQVYVEGELQTRSWEKDGVKHYKTEVNVFKLTMLGGNSESKPEPEPKKQTEHISKDDVALDDPGDDLPF